MSDDHGHSGDGEGEDDGAAGAVGGIAGGAEEAVGGVADLLGDGEDTADAREALETAGDIAESVEKGAKTAEDLAKAGTAIGRGDVGGAAGALGGALGDAGAGVGALTGAIGNMVPEEVRQGFQEASRVASAVGQVARGVGRIVESGAELLEGLLDQSHPVHFDLEIADEDAHFTVTSVHLSEALDELYEGRIEATFDLEHEIEARDLLTKDVSLTIERGDERRHFRGIVRHASVHRVHDHHVVHLDVAPALWLAAEALDSRIYQSITVPDLVEQVVRELLDSRQRTVNRDLLTERYEAHEYLVQHRESHFGFIARLLREEGIFFYFDHDAENASHEVLVLADSNSNAPLVRPSHDGVIEYDEQENRREGRELAFHVHRAQWVGATDAVVRGHDWTNPDLDPRHERTGRGDWRGPRLEVYDHHHAIRHHGYDDGSGSYQSHTAERQSRLRTERLDLARRACSVSTTVVTAEPGRVFELQGADTADGRYLITSMSSSGTAGDHGGQYTNTLQVIPADQPYRPPAPVRPVMPGPETAVVVGPPGEEIHTDRHGRIKVQFHWDRQGQRNEHSSAWIRVTQSWAGPGWGFVFIPRIGMEVIVSFLGGDPDRPIVTGCVYNGTNTPPYPLPQEKTKSTIKTNSSLGGGGSNELRFEDKAGSEEVYIHAQKDFNEVVEHDHSTHVKNSQTNTVDGKQTETVGGEQRMTVDKDRRKTIHQSERTVIGMNRSETVHGSEDVTVEAARSHTVKMDDKLHVLHGKRTVTVDTGKDVETYKGGRETRVSKFDDLEVAEGANKNTHVTGQYNIKSDGHFAVGQGDGHAEKLVLDNQGWWESPNQIQIAVAEKAAVLKMLSGGKIELSAQSEVLIHVNKTSFIKLTSSGIEISGPSIKIDATAGTTQIDAASQVKIKC